MAKQTGGIRLYWHPDFRIFSNYNITTPETLAN